ncbi:MAG: hypothetical protein WAN04_11825 [Candidatus Udaeobacter sp.]
MVATERPVFTVSLRVERLMAAFSFIVGGGRGRRRTCARYIHVFAMRNAEWFCNPLACAISPSWDDDKKVIVNRLTESGFGSQFLFDQTEEPQNENPGRIRRNIVFNGIYLRAANVGHSFAAAQLYRQADFADSWTGSLSWAESQGRVADIDSGSQLAVL